jgi:hypothetical protein
MDPFGVVQSRVNRNFYFIIIIIIIIIALINVHSKEDSYMKQILGNLFNFFLCFLWCLCVYCVTMPYLFCVSFVMGHCAVKMAH